MHCDEEKKDGMQAGSFEKYVLGLCNASEKQQVEALIANDPDLADKIERMKKAVRCYCTSCHSPKVKPILSDIDHFTSPGLIHRQAKLINLPCSINNTSGLIGKLIRRVRDFFRPTSGNTTI